MSDAMAASARNAAAGRGSVRCRQPSIASPRNPTRQSTILGPAMTSRVAGRWNQNTRRAVGSGSKRQVNHVSAPVDS